MNVISAGERIYRIGLDSLVVLIYNIKNYTFWASCESHLPIAEHHNIM